MMTGERRDAARVIRTAMTLLADDAELRKEAVWMAARLADRRYDGPAPDSQDLTRAEYVGRAVLDVLYADVTGKPT
jgi:hypothetical protein